MVRAPGVEHKGAMRIGSMLDLADCVLILDGHRIPLSEPSARGHGPTARWAFGVSAADAEFLASREGEAGIVQSRNGVVLMRMKVQWVDRTLHVAHAQAQPR